METPAYMLGALNVLVKAGEVSPAYAAGVASVLSKRAGFLWDTTAGNYTDAYRDWQAKNPGKAITPDEAVALVDNSRNWWEGDGVSFGDWAKNRWGKLTRWWPTDKMTGEMYDRQYKDMQNRARQERLARRGIALHPEVAGALQDAHMRDAGFRLEDAKRTMLPADREAAGLTDDYADTYRTTAGDSAVSGGAYKPQFHKAPGSGPQKATYGQNLPSSYGANKHMFYRSGYLNPLDQS